MTRTPPCGDPNCIETRHIFVNGEPIAEHPSRSDHVARLESELAALRARVNPLPVELTEKIREISVGVERLEAEIADLRAANVLLAEQAKDSPAFVEAMRICGYDAGETKRLRARNEELERMLERKSLVDTLFDPGVEGRLQIAEAACEDWKEMLDEERKRNDRLVGLLREYRWDTNHLDICETHDKCPEKFYWCRGCREYQCCGCAPSCPIDAELGL